MAVIHKERFPYQVIVIALAVQDILEVIVMTVYLDTIGPLQTVTAMVRKTLTNNLRYHTVSNLKPLRL